MDIIVATNNINKVNEIKSKLIDKDINIKTLSDINITDDIEEFGVTFEQNALIKAQYLSNLFPNDIIISDDSGLMVESLNNEPGVYSARYASDVEGFNKDKDNKNIEKLLNNLEGVDNRRAKFVTVICIIKPNEEPIFVKGEVNGEILTKKVGDNGFGYDPIFTNDGLKTFAQLTNEEKNIISHRALALEELFKRNIL